MALNVGKEMTILRQLTVPELQAKYLEVFGEPTRQHHKQYLIKRIIWRMQANEEGDLSERARQRAAELANDADLRLYAPRDPQPAPEAPEQTKVVPVRFACDNRLPMAGATIVRKYKGQMHEVKVLPGGFEHQGEVYRTLSAVAKAITGTHWNGYHFFKLLKDRKAS